MSIMLSRFLSFAAFSLIVSNAVAAEASFPSPFENSALGRCFPNPDSFIRNVLGESALSDENISLTAKGTWTWVIDRTASKNYTWYLLEARGAQVCLRVYVPAASHIAFKSKNNRKLVQAFIAPEADLPAKLIELESNPPSLAFRPAHCYLLKGGGVTAKAPKRKVVDCERILD